MIEGTATIPIQDYLDMLAKLNASVEEINPKSASDLRLKWGEFFNKKKNTGGFVKMYPSDIKELLNDITALGK